MEKIDQLGNLACRFRGSEEGSAEEKEAIAEYQRILNELIEDGEMECIGLDEELPDKYMGAYLKWLGV
jgi:hypothetical protein